METAVKPVNGTSLDFYLDVIDSSQEFYLYFHFAELEEVQAGQLKQFTILLNNNTIFGPIEPKYMASQTNFTQSSLGWNEMNFSLAMKTSPHFHPL